jgi:protoporphyrinogen oxidase
VYVPESKYPFYRVGCYTSFSSALAPPGHASLYVELAERAPPNLDTLLESVTAGLIEMGIIQAASDVEFARLRCIDPAYVIYDHAHASSLSVIKPFLDEVNIIAAGRYGDWNYSSMEDALRFGRRATRRALELVDE